MQSSCAPSYNKIHLLADSIYIYIYKLNFDSIANYAKNKLRN